MEEGGGGGGGLIAAESMSINFQMFEEEGPVQTIVVV